MNWGKLNTEHDHFFPPSTPADHAMGYNDTATFAVGGEDAGTPTLTVTPYSNAGGFSSDFGLAPASSLTGAMSFAASRSAWAAAHSDAPPASWALYAFGGVDGSGTTLATTARYDYVTRAWTPVNASGVPPSPRSLATAVYLPRCANTTTGSVGAPSGCFAVLGGVTAAGARLGGGSVLYLDGLAPSTRPYWYTPPTITTNGPSPRHSAAVSAGLGGNTAYVFGGDTAAGVTNDLYALAPQGFSPPLPSEMTNLAFHAVTTASSSDPGMGGSLVNAPPNQWGVAVDGERWGITRVCGVDFDIYISVVAAREGEEYSGGASH